MLFVPRYAQRLHQTLGGRSSIRTMSVNSSASQDSPVSDSNASRSPTTKLKVPHVPIPRRGVDYRGKIVLAPMVRSGELPSRLLALHYGADLVWGPETVDRSMIGTHQVTNPRNGCIEWTRPQSLHAHSPIQQDAEKENLIFRIDPKRESEKFIFQMGTNQPERAVAAANLVAPFCAGIDVNAGCPKSFSTDGGMGAALLTEEKGDLLARILVALVKEVGEKHEIGISVKIRLLSTREETSALVHKLCKTGITGLTIHCRTRSMRPRERAIREQLRMIGETCQSYGVACLMNGDVVSRDDGLKLAAEYDVDGAMIATAAEANSSVFLSGPSRPWREVVENYMRYALEVENRWGNTKFLLSQLMPGRDPSYAKVVQSKTYSEILQHLSLDSDVEMMKMAQSLDQLFGLGLPRMSRAELKKANKAVNRAKNEANIARKKRAAEQAVQAEQSKRERKTSPSRSRDRSTSRLPQTDSTVIRKAGIAAENAGSEGVGHGALNVAV